MAKVTGVVMSVDSRQVNTKFGLKPSFSISLDNGERYAAGFRAPACAVGDTVVLEYSDSSRYKDVTSVSKTAAAVSIPTAPVKSAAGPYTGSAKPFPIPPLHGDRAIIRQNALGHASRIYSATVSSGFEAQTPADIASWVITLAREFEAYATGDLDLAQAKLDMAREEIEGDTPL